MQGRLLKGILIACFVVMSFLPSPVPGSNVLHVPGDYATIQDAIDGAVNGDTVIVGDGIYKGDRNKNLDFGGKAIMVRSANGPSGCIIDGEGSGRGFIFHSGESASSIVSGLTVMNFMPGEYDYGGAILCDNSSPTIHNCIITLNRAGNGGGIGCWQASSPTIVGCTVSNNTADAGGGIWASRGNWIEGGTVTLANALVIGNVAYQGGGVFIYGYTSSITNCTVAKNQAQYAGAVWAYEGTYGVSNSILWDNLPDEITVGEITVSNSDVKGGFSGEGNIDADPLFISPVDGDFRLIEGSPCIDKGNNDSPGLMSTDRDGRPRIFNETVDMGAYEYGEHGARGLLWVMRTGTGEGKVISDPTGILCGENCSAYFPAGTKVTLRAEAFSGSAFVGWSGGGCSGTGECVVTIGDAVTLNIAAVINQVPLTNGLIAFYPFNGNANDWSGNGNNGTVHGAALTADRFGKPNSAYNFNGAGDFIDIAKPLPSVLRPDAITLSAWVLLNEYSNENSDILGAIVASQYDPDNAGYSIMMDYRQGAPHGGVPGGVHFQVGSGSCLWTYCSSLEQGTTNIAVPKNEWTHVIGMADSAAQVYKVYINGILVADWIPGDGIDYSDECHLMIGSNASDGPNGRFFNGLIDDVRIYNRALSDGEVAALYNAETTGYLDNGDETVTDSKTNLMWQQADDGVQRNWTDAGQYCADLAWGGHDDWRVPRVDELATLTDYSRHRPAMDPVFAHRQDNYWTSSQFVNNPDSAWFVDLFGQVITGSKISSNYVRCVRNGPFWPLDPSEYLVIHSGDTIQDTRTGYLWQRSADGSPRAWGEAKSYCDLLELDGYKDWRLPAIEELQTIVNYTMENPALTPGLFFGPSDGYWSSTVFAGDPGSEAWAVLFFAGASVVRGMDDTSDEVEYVRCVRGGSDSLATLSVEKAGSGTGRITSTPSGIDCGGICSASYPAGTEVKLKALADSDSIFTGWSEGGCPGTDECIVILDKSVNVAATFSIPTYSISGRVTTVGGAPLAGVIVVLSGAASAVTTTDEGGFYSFIGLSSGVYSITPSKGPYEFTPSRYDLNINDSDIEGRDFTGVLPTGSLSVTLLPAGAISAGAQWRISGGEWKASGATLSNIVAGQYTLEFKDTTGWTKPGNQTVTISRDQNTNASGSYQMQGGALSAIISPDLAVAAGAQWRVDEGEWMNSGATVWGMTPGRHLLEFKGIPGWNTPQRRDVTIARGNVSSVTGVYERQKGWVSVVVRPVEAIQAGAMWRIDGGAWNNSGNIVSVYAGLHTLEFKNITGWIKPNEQGVDVANGQMVRTTVNYVLCGALSVTLSPLTAVGAVARWRVGEGEWHKSGEVLRNLAPGEHTVDFKEVGGWNKPDSLKVAVSSGQTAKTAGKYVRQTGVLEVVLAPQTAAELGARWRVDGGKWNSSGETISALSVGQHTIDFADIYGWTAPRRKNVTVLNGEKTSFTGIYEQQTGRLTVTIVPRSAIVEGALWRVDGGTWKNSGEVVAGLGVGTHSVEFATVSGRTTPSGQNVEIMPKETAMKVAEYMKAGVPLVSINTVVADASESGTPGRVAITANGKVTANQLRVYYYLGGTARNGGDYWRLPVDSWGLAEINVYGTQYCSGYGGYYYCQSYYPPASIDVRPLSDNKTEGDETVTFYLVESSGYEVGYPSMATVTIRDAGTVIGK